MIRASKMHCQAVLILGLLLGCMPLDFQVTALLAAESNSPSAEPTAVEYRRIFVPAGAPETWPVDGQRYLPIARSTFDRLVGADRHALNGSPPARVHINTASYRAELRADNQLRVLATLDVELFGSETELLRLSPLNLSIRSARWLTPEARPADLGLWQRAGGELVQAVSVEKSGRLVIEGLLAASKSRGDRYDFEFRTPSVVPQTLELSLPPNCSSEIAGSQLLKSELGALGESIWTYLLPSNEVHQIRLQQSLPTRDEAMFPSASQSTSYYIDPAGLDVVTELLIGASELSTPTLTAHVPIGLRVAEVLVGDQGVPWRVVTEQGRQQLMFQRPAVDSPQLLQIRCLAQAKMGSAWKLPKLEFDDVHWTEGTSRVVVPASLALQSLNPSQCALQHVVGISSEENEGEVYRFQEWSDEASIELQVARPEPQLKAETLTKLELAPEDSKATVIANLTNVRGKIYQIQANVAPGWFVEAVKASPNAALSEWHVDQTDSAATLYCQLANPISRQYPVRLEIEARSGQGKRRFPTSVGNLKVIRFLDAHTDLELLQLNTSQPEQYVLADHLQSALMRSPEQLADLPSELRDDVGLTASVALVDVSTLSNTEVLELGRQPPEFRAQLHLEIDVLPDELRHDYRIDVSVASGSVSEIILEASEPLPESMRWEIATENTLATATVKAARVVDASARPSAARYRLSFSEPVTSDFRLVASYSRPAAPLEYCNLLNLPDNLRWDGQAIVRGSLEGMELLDHTLTPSTLQSDRRSPDNLELIGSYRLSPEDFRRNSKIAALQIKRVPKPHTVPQLVCWTGEYQTIQAANGAALHAANYLLESTGEQVAKLSLPQDVQLLEVWLDNRQLEPLAAASGEDSYAFNLGDSSATHRLALRYSTQRPQLSGSAVIRPILPSCEFPIHLNRWTLWAPEQYEIDNSAQNYSLQEFHWWKRMFGPLSRARHESVFNPLGKASWSELWSETIAVQESKQLTGKLASHLVERIRHNSNRPFGTILADLITESGLEQLVRVDAVAMRSNGIEWDMLCHSLVERLGYQDAAMIRSTPLSSFDLALLASPEAIVLTTSERIAHWQYQLRQTRVAGVHLVTSDALADSLGQLRNTSSDFIPVKDWLLTSSQTSVHRELLDTTDLVDVGRQAHTVEFSDHLPALVVRQAHVQLALWYGVLFFALVLGVWKLAHYPNIMILIGAVAGAACLIVPSYWLTIPQAVFLGLVAAALVSVVLKSSQFAEQGYRTTRRVISTLAVLLVVLACQDQASKAQESSQKTVKSGAEAKLPKVLIPIDADGARQGEDVYLSERFLMSLEKLSLKESRPADAAVVLEAQYDAKLPEVMEGITAQDSLVISDPWTLHWKIETSRPNQPLLLPLSQSDATWNDAQHLLDGLPTALQWLDEKGCKIIIPEAGTHWLQIVCRPKYALSERDGRVSLDLPAFPGAVLNLKRPIEITDVQVQGASQLPVAEAPSQLRFLLSPAGTLTVRWQRPLPSAAASPWDRLEQSSWLTVVPATTRLDVQLQVVGLRTDLQKLSLSFSESLRLLEPTSDSPIAKILDANLLRPGRVELELKPNLPADVVIPLSFELKRAGSIGQIYFPEVAIQGRDPDVHRFAVSVASGLSYDQRGANDLRTLEPQEFLNSWDGEALKPLFTYALDLRAPAWSLKVWPDPLSFRAKQSLSLHCGLKEVDVECDIDVEDVVGQWHTHQLQVPDALQIEHITIRELNGGRLVPLRWSRANASAVSIFLSRPMNGSHVISIQGRIGVSDSGLVDVPRIQLVGSGRTPVTMDLYRTEAVKLDWATPENAPPQTPNQRNPLASSELHAGSFSWRSVDPDRSSELLVEKNDVSFSAQSVTSVEKVSEGWKTHVNSRIYVRQGILNRLRIDVPPNVRAPFILKTDHSGVTTEVIETPNGQQVRVLLAKPAAEDNEVKITLSGRLVLPADQRLVVPSLRWSGAVRSKRYVLLPTRVDNESIIWLRRGLRRQALPLALAELAIPSEDSLCFRIGQDAFQAEQRNAQPTMLNARVRHATISGFLDRTGALVATAELFIQPGRATSCAIRLPEQSTVFQLVVGDQPARREQQRDGSWKVPIGPPFLPQRILVSYRCPTQKSGHQCFLVPPAVLLGDQTLPTPKVFWQLRTPLDSTLRVEEGGRSVQEHDLASQNYQALLQIVNDALPQTLDLPREEGRHWSEAWLGIIQQAQRKWQPYRPQSDRAQELAAAAEMVLALEDAFAEQEGPDQPSSYSLTYPFSRYRILKSAAKRNEYYFASDSSNPLAVSVSHGSQGSWWRWIAAMALLGGAAMTVSRLRHHPDYYHDLCHWPHALALVSGMLWWLLLKPSALGMLVVALALVSLALQHWRANRGEKVLITDSRVAISAS